MSIFTEDKFENGDEFEELEALFGINEEKIKEQEKIVLSQNLEGFAACFPEWDLHPPVR